MIDDDAFRRMEARLADLLPQLNERDRRLALAAEAKSLGRGGISAVHRATGASRSTIRRGLVELEGDDTKTPTGTPIVSVSPAVVARRPTWPTLNSWSGWIH